jgi:hypothetical protein
MEGSGERRDENRLVKKSPRSGRTGAALRFVGEGREILELNRQESRLAMGTLMSRFWKSDVKGNVNKYRSYQEAWLRIKAAQEQGFYIEAVNIEESIICDRIVSGLLTCGTISVGEDGNCQLRFLDLIKEWRKWAQAQCLEPIVQKELDDLISAVDKWRKRRNAVIHGVVKSSPNTPGHDIEQFVGTAEATAEEGRRLARAVDNWQRRIKRSIQRSAAAPRRYCQLNLRGELMC